MPEPDQVVITVLLIEDDEDDSVLIRGLLAEVASARYKTTWVETYKDALAQLRDGKYDVCLLDYRLGSRTGTEILRDVSECADKPPIIILTGHGDYKVDVEAMKLGAADFLEKGELNEHMLERTIRYAIERKKSETALRESEKQLDYLSSQLLLVQENERRKIAAELHDNLGQVLTAIKYNIETIMNRMSGDGDSVEDLRQVIPLVQGAVEHVRGIYTRLRPSTLDDLGVKATLSWYCREFEGANNKIRVNRQFAVEEDEIPEGLKLTIFRIVQDAMGNIASHSRAANAWLSLSMENAGLGLTIRDDGRGFDVGAMMSQTDPDSGLGLRSMKRRAELSGGALDIVSREGTGTTVRVLWPKAKA
ncbi:MAG: response regulator [Syntrophobacteraceae bacterium]